MKNNAPKDGPLGPRWPDSGCSSYAGMSRVKFAGMDLSTLMRTPRSTCIVARLRTGSSSRPRAPAVAPRNPRPEAQAQAQTQTQGRDWRAAARSGPQVGCRIAWLALGVQGHRLAVHDGRLIGRAPSPASMPTHSIAGRAREPPRWCLRGWLRRCIGASPHRRIAASRDPDRVTPLAGSGTHTTRSDTILADRQGRGRPAPIPPGSQGQPTAQSGNRRLLCPLPLHPDKPGLPATPTNLGVLMRRGLTRPPCDLSQGSTTSQIGLTPGCDWASSLTGAQPATL